MKVFISYSRKDAEFVNKLKEALKASDIGVIIDVESLEFGDNLQEFVERSVRGTDLTIAVISKHSLQSVWVVAEALETLMYEHVEGKKRFLPIYIDTSFLDDTLYLQIVEQIDASIANLKDLTIQGIDRHLGTVHLDQKRARFITLRNNLDQILKKLADVLVADFSSEEKFTKNLPKLIESIKLAEKEREQYTGRPSAYRAPFQAPPLPQHFVPRPEVTDVLKARLLNEGPTTPGILVVSAIHGLGGIGKSTLAAALAYDKEVQERFPDGILWATLGQQPEILSLISGWIHEMRDYDFRPTTVEAASAHLRTLLQDKAILLVVDDVWNPEHAKHFRVGGLYCQVLITTRRADVADEVGAELHQMDVMTPEQSLDLLAARLQRPLDAAERSEALSLAETVGYLPLALELAAVRVARGMSWAALCDALKQKVANLEALEGSPRRRRKRATTLEASFNLSLNALRNEDEQAWQAFVWLGVLPEDVQIVAPMVSTLWEMEQAEAHDLLELLWNDALLLLGSPIIVGENEWPSYRLHDLLHDIARKLLTTKQPQGLGFTLPEAHATLLEHYKQHTQNGLWHTLPEDGYIHNNLTWHFQQAQEEEQIHTLLREETEEGDNGWYQAREQLGQTAGFLSDVNLAMKRAEEEADIGLQCRYALIIASINSLAKNVPPNLVGALVEKGIWLPAQGLTYACQIPEPAQRAKTLIKLIPHLPDSLKEDTLQKVLTVERTIVSEETQAEVLIGVIPYLSVLLLQEALEAIRAIEDVWARAKALVGIAPHLVKLGIPEEALIIAQAIEGEWYRAEALVKLAPHLSTSLLRKAIAVTQMITDARVRAEALARLAIYLPESLRENVQKEALVAAQTIASAGVRAETLARLAIYLPESLRENVQKEALVAAQTIANVGVRAEALARLAIHLPKSLRRNTLLEALVAAQMIEHELVRAEVLSVVAPQLAEIGIPEEALTTVQTIEHGWYRAKALKGVMPHLPESLLQEALVAAQMIEEAMYRAEVLAGIIPFLPESLRENTLREVWVAVQMTGGTICRTEVLSAVALDLPESLLRKALMAAQVSVNVESWYKTLEELICQLVELGAIKEAFVEVQAIEDGLFSVDALMEIVPHLPEPLRENALRKAWTMAQEIDEMMYRAVALVKVAPHLPEPIKENALREAWVIAQKIKHTEIRATTLAELAPWMVELGAFDEALTAVQAIGEVRNRVKVLAGIIPRLPESLKENVLRETMVEVQTIEDEWTRAKTLENLAFRLAEQGTPEEAFIIAQMIEDKFYRAGALIEIVPHLSELLRENALREALTVTQAIEDIEYRDLVLAGIACRLAELGNLKEALTTVQSIEDVENQAWALTEVVPHLSELLLRGALTTAQEIGDVEARAKMLARIVPHLPEPMKESALREFWIAIKMVEQAEVRTRIFAEIFSQLVAVETPGRLWEAAQNIENAWARAKALAMVLPLLQEPIRENALQKVVESILEAETQAGTLKDLACWLAELSSTDLLSIWQKLFERLANQTREDLLVDLGALTPIIAALGGKEAVIEIFHAIQDVDQWWPYLVFDLSEHIEHIKKDMSPSWFDKLITAQEGKFFTKF